MSESAPDVVIDAAFVQGWLRAFIFTQLVEVPIYLALGKTRFVKAFSLSLITHPVLWFVFWVHVHLPYEPKIAVGEILVVAIEALVLWAYERQRLTWQRALVVAFVANLASSVLGELCRYFFGLP